MMPAPSASSNSAANKTNQAEKTEAQKAALDRIKLHR